MRRQHNKSLIILLLLIFPSLSWALASDREQPIEIEADHAQIDEQQGVTQYKGKAILTQGTLRIQGDIITFYYDENNQLKKAVAQGKFATYQQIQKKGEAPVKARALQMEYHARAQKIYLIGKGHVQKEGDIFSGEHIEYDINRNIVNASSKAAKPGSGSERIHIIIQPPGSKKKSDPAPVTPVPQSQVDSAEAVENVESHADTAKTATDAYPTATTLTNLNIRTGPGTQYPVIDTFNTGDFLYLLTEQKDWVQVRGEINGQAIIGWVYRRYINHSN